MPQCRSVPFNRSAASFLSTADTAQPTNLTVLETTGAISAFVDCGENPHRPRPVLLLDAGGSVTATRGEGGDQGVFFFGLDFF